MKRFLCFLFGHSTGKELMRTGYSCHGATCERCGRFVIRP